jgi:hypothetical protein
MSVTRRQFFLSTAGAAAGFILPSYYVSALKFFERFEEPLLVPPKHVVDELFIVSEWGDELNLGDPYVDPPVMTWRAALEKYYPWTLDDVEDYWYGYGLTESKLDETAPWDWVVDAWANHDSPAANAYHLLQDLDLGPNLTDPDAVGGLIFSQSASPCGNDFLSVTVQNEISISLLQQRLNDLGTGIRIHYV